MSNSDLLEELRGRELRGGGWGFFGSRQVSLEATSLATPCVLAERPFEALRLAKLFSGVQLADGSWPSFVGDRESSWTTALAICALNSVNDPSKARERGESWLLRTKGREGHWFWRWKFKTADRTLRGQAGNVHVFGRAEEERGSFLCSVITNQIREKENLRCLTRTTRQTFCA